MSTPYQLFVGKFALASDCRDFAISGQAMSLNVQNYFFLGESNSLVNTFQGLIRTHASHTTANVLYTNTGHINICLTAAGNIVFSDSYLGKLLGFEYSNYSNGLAFYCGENYPYHVWRPTRAASEYPHSLVGMTSICQPRSMSFVGRSVDGTDYSVEGRLLYDLEIRYRFLPSSDVIRQSSSPKQNDFYSFFCNQVHKGYPVRIYSNRELLTNSDHYEQVRIVRDVKTVEAIGAFDEYSSREVKNYNGLWSITVRGIKSYE